MPKTSAVTPNSNIDMLGRTSTATERRGMPPSWHESDAWCHSSHSRFGVVSRQARGVTRSALAPPTGLGRAGGVAAGFASVVGAGLLGLPAAVLHETGSAAVLTWLVAAVLCVPMIVLFRDTVLRTPGSSDPLRDAVRAGLGRRWGDRIPLMFPMVVMIGLPTNAVVAASNLAAATGLAVPPTVLAALLLGLAVATNLAGAAAGARVQQWGAIALVAVLTAVLVWLLSQPVRPAEVVPTVPALGAVPAGVLLAFWAFVGFENLTFLARDLSHPRRDFTAVSLISLGLLVTLAIGLTLAIAVRSAPVAVDPVTGLVDAARGLPGGPVGAVVVALAGAGGILLNALAWVRGVGLVLDSAAREGLAPAWIAGPDARQPRRAIGVLAGGFAVTLVVLQVFPGLVVDALAAASAVFVVIYLICIVAYARSTGPRPWTLANLALVPIMLVALWQSGLRSAYALVVLFVASLLTRRRH
ncbi:hypothetical protein CGZ96_16705 [Enemella evansiae]|nr:hypothetical protein CGZ96_16705 [Enemella evansiae]